MQQTPQKLAILFADIGESTQLYARLGDTEAHRQISLSLKLMEAAIVGCEGVLLRTVGDAVLASFSNCDDAFFAAKSIQQAHQHEILSVRVGFHYGDVIPDKGDVYGNAVNVAARIASFARLNEISLSVDAANQLSPGNKACAQRIDAIPLKGLDNALEIYRIEWQDDVDQNTVVATSYNPSNQAVRQTVAELSVGNQQLLLDDKNVVVQIGRDDSSGLQLHADCVSRHHLQLRLKDGQITLADNSTNGTFISREGHNPLFVRRESVVLEGTGLLGVGASPEGKSSHTVAFTVRYL